MLFFCLIILHDRVYHRVHILLILIERVLRYAGHPVVADTLQVLDHQLLQTQGFFLTSGNISAQLFLQEEEEGHGSHRVVFSGS